jgi:hypothetical protein
VENAEGHPMSRKQPRLRATFAVMLAVVAALAAYAAIPRHADLTAFDPGETARLETLMWRHYYDKRSASQAGRIATFENRINPPHGLSAYPGEACPRT